MKTVFSWRQILGAAAVLFGFDLVQWCEAILREARRASGWAWDAAHAVSVALLAAQSIAFAALVLFMVGLAGAAWRRLRSRLGSELAASGCVALAAAIPVGVYFSAGKGLRDVAPRWITLPALTLLVAVGAVVAFFVARFLASWIADRHSTARLATRLFIVAGSLAAFYADTAILWGLYPPLHFLLSACGIIGVAVAFADESKGRGVHLAVLFGLAAVGLVASPVSANHLPLAHTRAVLNGVGARQNALIAHQARALLDAEAPRPSGLGAPSAAESGLEPSGSEQPHVLLVSIDGVRAADVGFLGASRDTTPFLDEMAEGALVFERAYSPGANTHRTLNNILTGGAIEPLAAASEESAEALCPSEMPAPTLPQVFSSAGYHTVCDFVYESTKLACAARGCEVRADSHDREETFELLVRRVRHSEQPVFALVHLLETHAPYRGFGPKLVEQTPGWSSYQRSLHGMDRALRALYEELSAVVERPIVWVFMSDHGEALGEHGHETHHSSVFEEQVHVPLVLRGPGIAPRRVETPVSLGWLYGTLRGLAGERPAATTLPVAGDAPAKPAVFVQNKAWYGVIDGRWKYIELRDIGARWLFDLQRDPDEAVNLLGAHPRRARRLESLLDARFPH